VNASLNTARDPGANAPWFTIVNPAAGGGRCAARARDALFTLREAGHRLVTHETDAPGAAARLAREAYHAGHRRFLSVGGDGTHYEVANGLFPHALGDPAVTLGMLPLGTGNSFLRDFAIDGAAAAIRSLLGGARRRVDVVRVTHRAGQLHYLNLLSIGFPAGVGAITNRRFKPLGTLGYALAVVVAVSRLGHPRFRLTVDGGPTDDRPCTFLSFSNSRFTGGSMMMAPTADPADGALDVVRMGPIGRGALLASFPRIFRGTHQRMAAYEHALARRVDFALDAAVDAMIDGEVLSLHLESLEVLPGALEVAA